MRNVWSGFKSLYSRELMLLLPGQSPTAILNDAVEDGKLQSVHEGTRLVSQESKSKHEALRDRARRAVQKIEQQFSGTLETVMDEVKEGPLTKLREWCGTRRKVR